MADYRETKKCDGPFDVVLMSNDTEADVKQEARNAISKTYDTISNVIKVQALKIASKIKYQSEVQEVEEVEIPVPKEFELGDVVKVACSLKDLKSIQQRTAGWDVRLKRFADRFGYITRLSCGFGNNVAVRYPNMSFVGYYYPGVLEKVSQEELQAVERKVKKPFPDFRDAIVSTISDWEVLQSLQKGTSKLMRHFCSANGEKVKGKVITQFSGKVLVSFTGLEAFLMHPASLNIEEDEAEEFKYPEIKLTYPSAENPFEVGETVKVTTNIRELFIHNLYIHLWNRNLSEIAGRAVKIIGIKAKNYVAVSLEEEIGPSWYLSAEYLFRDGEEDPKKNGEELPFYPGDVVKIRREKNIAEILKEEGIPLSFLEYLQTSYEILSYSEDVKNPHPKIKIMSNYCVLDAKLLEKVTDEEEKKYKEWKEKSDNLRVGSKVFFDVSSPNYVRDILEESGFDEEVIHALTTSADVVEILDPYHVLIKYPDGKKYNMHKRFLTDPGKFNVDDEKMEFGIQELNGILSEILKVIPDKGRKVGGKAKRCLEILSMSFKKGIPPMIQLLFYSLEVNQEVVLDALQMREDLKIEKLAEDMFLIEGFNSYKSSVIIELEVTHEKFKKPSKKRKSDPVSVQGSFAAGKLGGRLHPGRRSAGAGPSRNVESEGRRPASLQSGGVLVPGEHPPPGRDQPEGSGSGRPQRGDPPPGGYPPQGGNGDARRSLELYRLPLRDGRMGRNVNFLYEVGKRIRATGPDQDQPPIIIPIRGGGNLHDHAPLAEDYN